MCGFVLAIYKEHSNKDFLNNKFKEYCDFYIKKRGPTSQEIFKSNSLFAYQSTLAIQTLRDETKPISGLNSLKFILYNGEIYISSKDKNESDTKLILSNWKNGCLDKFLKKEDGMYALCTVDRTNENNILINCYRDFPGEKHIWYYIDQNIFILSSVPAIIRKYLKLTNSLKLNQSALEDYLLRRHFISPVDLPIKGIKQILPGEKLNFSSYNWELTLGNFIKESDFFSTCIYKKLLNYDENFYNNQFKEILEKTLLIMEKNTPCKKVSSSIISGGLDSSIVSFILNKFNQEIKLFTMTFQNKDKVAMNSPNLIRKLTNQNKVEHNLIECTMEDYLSSLKESIDILSSPITTHSIPSSYLIAKEARKNGSVVLYGGEGADEIFLGYGCYSNSNLIDSDYNRTYNFFKKNLGLRKRVIDGLTNHYIETKKKELENFFSSVIEDNSAEKFIKIESFIDTFIQLSSVGLISTDTINSNLGIECRTPFTRKDLLTFGLSTPLKYLINDTPPIKSKLPIRNAFINYFGSELLMPKIGFAGFPNETKSELGDINKWLLWDYFGWAKDNYEEYDINEKWKLINIEWFLRICL